MSKGNQGVFNQVLQNILNAATALEAESTRLADWVRDNPGQTPDNTHLLHLEARVQIEIENLGEINKHFNDSSQS